MAEEYLRSSTEQLKASQELLWASGSDALLVVLQAMDAGGKDGTIKHVMSGINPQGCQVVAFKEPSTEELAHDFLWRYSKSLPERGQIGIFNRSYYEEVLVVRVHPELLGGQWGTSGDGPADRLWSHRFEDINSLRAPPPPQRHENRQDLPSHLQGGAEETNPPATRQSGQVLEVLHIGSRGAEALGPVPGCV